MKRGTIVSLCVWVVLANAWCSSAYAVTLGITADGKYFTIDGNPTYLLGVSYYGAQTISTPSWVTQDLDDMVARGFNWIRVWSTWDASDTGAGDCSALTSAGVVREPYMTRLKTLITECNNRGMIVDVSMCRNWGGPTNLSEHLAYAQTLATQLASFPNIYFDIANECDVMDARYVSPSEITQIVARCKQYKPGVLCTASQTPTSASALYNMYIATGCDFIAPHLCRDQGCASQTYGTVTNLITWMNQYSRRMPVQLQEPFRRGYTTYNPVLSDFLTDCAGGKDAQGAGWCFHNGAGPGDTRPYRCFDMKNGEGRLFAQIDSEEWKVVNQVYGYINGTALWTAAPVIREVSPDPDTVNAGTQYIRPMVLTQGNPWPSWSLLQGPAGAQINTNGQVTWTPTSADIGQTRTFQVQATNTHGSDTETWQVTVQSGPLATFEAEGANMYHQAGSAITGGWRITTANPNKFSTYGPYTTILPAGPLTARYWLRVDNNTADNTTICQLDINDADGVVLAGPVAITRQQFSVAGAYQAFDVNFVNPGNNHRIEFRTYYIGNAQLDQDKVEIVYQGGNYPPTVSAGTDQQLSWPGTVNLDGTVVDDGLPNPPATVTVTWSKVSGPGTVTFGNANAADTTATLSASGIYVLRLTASDSVYTVSDEVTITAVGANDFIISNEQFIGSGTLGDSSSAGELVHGRCDSSGNLHVVWYKNGSIAYRKRAVGGSWGTEETIPDSSGMNSDGPRLAVTSAGDVHVFWNPPAWNPLYYSIRTSSGWGARQTLIYNSDNTHASCPAPTFASDGRLHLIWLRWYPSTGAGYWYHRIKTGSTWSADSSVSPSMYDGYVLVPDTTGKVYAAGRVMSSYNRAGYQIWNNSWGAVQTPANDVNHWVGGTHLAIGPSSTLAMSFAGYNETGGVWYIAGAYGLTVGQSSVKLTQSSQCVATTRCEEIQPKVAFDSLGNQYFVWTDGDQLRYAIRRADGTWYARDLNFPVGGGKQYYPDITAFGTTVHVLWEDYRGGMYHATITPPGGNLAPSVYAGADQTITLPSNANLDGTVSDDGLPNPPATVTVTWSKTSGPGTVTFGNANAVDTTASFSTSGTYVLRLTASDSVLSAYDELTITVNPAAGPPGKATNPNPANGALGVSKTTTLSWTIGGGATSHKIYFGTSSPPPYQTQQTATTYSPGTLASFTTYYWRIDEVNTYGTTTGDPWSFTTESIPADFDADGDVDAADFGYLQRCYSGSGVAPASGCNNADLDGDNDVDQTDFTQFKSCLGGADQPPGC